MKLLGALFLAAVVAAFAPARGALYDTERGRWLCSTPPPTVYLTSLFEMKGLGESSEAENAFAQALAAKYGYSGSVDCSMADKSVSLEQLNVNKANRTAALRKEGVKVIETEWAFEPSAARFSYVCNASAMRTAEGQSVSVHTDPIAIGAGAARRLQEAWAHHLAARGLSGSGRRQQCTLLPATAPGAEFKSLAVFNSLAVGEKLAWNGWDDGDVSNRGEPTAGGQYFCDAWAFPPGLPPTYFWTGVFESARQRAAIEGTWRDRLKSNGRVTGPLPSTFCFKVGVPTRELENARERRANEVGAKPVRIQWKE